MLFIDSPSQLEPSAIWQAYRLRLDKLNPHDRTVVAEKLRAERMVSLHKQEEILDAIHHLNATPSPVGVAVDEEKPHLGRRG